MLFYFNEEPWEVLLHGDAYINNMIFRYDQVTGKQVEVVLIDLQMCHEGDPFKNVNYALYPALQRPCATIQVQIFPKPPGVWKWNFNTM